MLGSEQELYLDISLKVSNRKIFTFVYNSMRSIDNCCGLVNIFHTFYLSSCNLPLKILYKVVHTTYKTTQGCSHHIQDYTYHKFFLVFSSNIYSFIHQSICPMYNGLPSHKTKFLHMSLSLSSSSVSPISVILRLTLFTHLSFGFPFLRVTSGSHSRILLGNLFPVILFRCTKFIAVFLQ